MEQALILSLDSVALRFTPEGKVSVVDAIRAVSNSDSPYFIWENLKAERPEILLYCFDTDRFDAALANLEKLLSDYAKSHSAHEAIYLRGVSLYKNTDDPKPLKQAYEKLQENYPDSEWTKRAYPYRLL